MWRVQQYRIKAGNMVTYKLICGVQWRINQCVTTMHRTQQINLQSDEKINVLMNKQESLAG